MPNPRQTQEETSDVDPRCKDGRLRLQPEVETAKLFME
jgi:hypothetical protein